MRSPRPAALGWALFLCSGTASALAAALATETFADVSPAAGSGFSFALAGLLVVATRRPPTGDWSAARWRATSALGAITMLNVVALYLALDRLPLGTAITVEFLGPLSLAVIHARRVRDYLGALGAIAGVALVSGASADADPLGLLLAGSAACCWALYILAARRAGSYARPLDSLVVALGVGGLLALPLALVACFQISGWATIALLLAVAVSGRILPYLFEILALQMMTAGAAGVLFSVLPAIAALVGFIVLGQTYAPLQILGALSVVAAGALVMRDASP